MAGSGSARPTGVTVLAVLSFIGGIFGLLGSLAVFGIGAVATAVLGGLGAVVMLMSLVTLVLSIAEIALGYGFFTIKPWAWRAATIIWIVSVIVSVVSLLVGGGGITSLVVQVVITGIVLYYLNQPSIRRLFGAPESGFPLIGSALDNVLPKGN